MIDRRTFLVHGATGLLLVTRWWSNVSAPTFEVVHTDAEWKQLLTREQYAVLRHEATEPPFSSPLDHEKRRGTFVCAGCGQELFSSATKFDSGTGWPSFWTSLNNAVLTSRDS